MVEFEEQTLQEVLQWLTLYFAKSKIQEGIFEIQVAKKDQSEESIEKWH